jgi:hypothetical protein
MRVVKVLVGVTVLMLTLTVRALAQDNGTPPPPPPDQPMQPAESPPPENPAETPATPTPTAAPEGAIMQGLDAIGIGKPMKDLNLSVYGYVDAGYFYDFTVTHNLTPPRSPSGDMIGFVGPYKNQFDLDQVDLGIERTIDPMKGNFDIGFKIEGNYGRDDYFTHSTGVLDQSNKAALTTGVGSGPDDQLDIPQAYVTLAVPIEGLSFKAGKFSSILGTEQVNPTENLFYTHSYTFTFGAPYTMTGALASYQVNDTTGGGQWTFLAGATCGWDQTLYDYNDPDGIFQISHTNGPLSWTVNLLIGPEGEVPYGPEDYADWWFVPEAIASYKISDQLTITGDLLYGDATHLAQWLGLAGYVHYSFDKYIAANVRGEFYYDQNGVTTGVGGPDVDYFEVTLGLGLTPLPDSSLFQSLTIRPEVRGDFATQSVLDFSKRTQLTAAVDVYWKF